MPQSKQGDRTRTPRSPFGLKPKRPEPTPAPQPPRLWAATQGAIEATVARAAGALPARVASAVTVAVLETVVFPALLLLMVLFDKVFPMEE